MAQAVSGLSISTRLRWFLLAFLVLMALLPFQAPVQVRWDSEQAVLPQVDADQAGVLQDAETPARWLADIQGRPWVALRKHRCELESEELGLDGGRLIAELVLPATTAAESPVALLLAACVISHRNPPLRN